MTEIKIDRDRYAEQTTMIRWCESEFGEWQVRNGLERWGVTQSFGYAHFYFREEEDATVFVLRWL